MVERDKEGVARPGEKGNGERGGRMSTTELEFEAGLEEKVGRRSQTLLSLKQPRYVFYWSAFVSEGCDKSKIEEYKVTNAIAFGTAVVAKCRNQMMFAMNGSHRVSAIPLVTTRSCSHKYCSILTVNVGNSFLLTMSKTLNWSTMIGCWI